MIILANRRHHSGSPDVISNGDIKIFECADFIDVADRSTGNGVLTQETFDSRSTWKADGGTPFDASNSAHASYDPDFTLGARQTISGVLYHDSLGASTATGSGQIQYVHRLGGYYLITQIYADVLQIRDSSAVNQTVATGKIPIGSWYTLTFDIINTDSASMEVDVYVNAELVAENIDCAWAYAPDLNSYWQQLARESSPFVQRISYIDRWLIGGGLA